MIWRPYAHPRGGIACDGAAAVEFGRTAGNALGSRTPWSILADIRCTGTDLRCLMDNARGGSTFVGGPSLYTNGGRVLARAVQAIAGNAYVIIQLDTLINDGDWHSVLATYNALTGTEADFEGYLDGATDAHTHPISGIIGVTNLTSAEPPTLGAFADGAGFPFDGDVGRVCMWSRALSAAEAHWHTADRRRSPNPSGLVFWAPAAGFPGPVPDAAGAVDEMAGGQHGTLTAAGPSYVRVAGEPLRWPPRLSWRRP